MKSRENFVRKIKLQITALLVFVVMIANAQQVVGEFSVHLFPVTSNEGLSQGFVPSIIQDHRGFIWFATKDGLNKYDGYSFTVYRHDPGDKFSIGDNLIQEIFEDSRGYIWISMPRETDVFDPYTETFQKISLAKINGAEPPTIYQLTEDSLGNMWGHCSTGYEELKLTPTNKNNAISFGEKYSVAALLAKEELKRYKLFFEPDIIAFNYSGDMWITKNDSLFIISEKDQLEGKITNGFADAEFCHLPGARIYNFEFDRPHHTTFVSTSEGIILYDNKTKSIAKTYAASIPNFVEKSLMKADANGNLWIFMNDRLSIFNSVTGNLSDVTPKNIDEKKWLSYSIKSILVDRSGIIWMGTNGYGCFKYNPRVSCFKLYDEKIASGLTGDNKGRMYVRQNGDIYRFDPSNEKLGEKMFTDAVFQLDISGQKHFPDDFVQDNEGIYWLNYGSGHLARYDEKNKKIKFFSVEIPEAGSKINFSRIWLDNSQHPWVAIESSSSAYIAHFNPVTEEFDAPVSFPEKRTNKLYSFVSAVLPGADGKIWFGTMQGLFCYSIANKSWQAWKNIPGNNESLSNDVVFSLCFDPIDPAKYIWAGTNSGGLNRLDIAHGTFLHFTEKQSLPNNVVYGLLPGDSANIWLSTNKGICRFNVNTHTCKNYFASDGLQGNEFNRYIYFKSGDGTLYFGGVNGLNFFKEEDLYFKDVPPIISFTGLRLFNEEISFRDSNAIISRPIDFLDELVLNYNQNVITINFVAMDFASPDKNQFKYKLEGFDKDWVFSGTRHEAIYTGLAPGEHILYVKAANSEGIWSDQSKSIRIIILPPWWGTWLAKTFFIIGIITIVAGIILLRTASLRRSRNILEGKVRERTQKLNESLIDLKQTQKQLIKNEKLASFGQLTAGIAHEIKNPLNFITNFSELGGELIDELRTAKSDEERDEILESLKNNLVKINFHSARVDSIIKSMLNHSRTAGATKQVTDINTLCEEFTNLAYHSMRANVQDFSCQLKKNLDKELPKLEAVPQDISRVLLNLLNNAFYAVNEKRKTATGDYKPEVVITTMRENNMAVVSVRDNGCGISPEAMEKLFDPFFTTKPSGEGTGLGLSISYDIIQSHGGKMTVESRPDEFTEFTFRIPLKS